MYDLLPMTDKRGTGGRKPSPRRKPGAPARKRPTPDSRVLVHLDDALVRELRSAARPGKREILVKVMAEALTAYSEGDLGEAIRLGEQAKHLALRSTTAREFLGLVYYAAGRYRDAITELAAFRRMAATAEQNPVLADCYRAEGKPAKALELAEETRAPGVPEAVRYEGEIVAAGALTDMGELDAALDRLAELDLEPSVASEHHLRAWYVMGDLLERRGRFTQAARYFESVVGADADLTDAPERLARLRAGG